jgi:pyridoxamine 5'-phosphate oxidase
VSADPLEHARDWYEEAVAAGLPEPDAMALATATPDGRPSVRFVLVKGIDADGVRFFTNYESRKGRELDANPRAAVSFYWQPLQRALRMEGVVSRVGASESDAYFASRERDSRLGARASDQGRPLPDRDVLDARLREAAEEFPDDVPRPDYWGGYRLRPDAIEFWSGRANRLHDREHFLRGPDGTWRAGRLFP